MKKLIERFKAETPLLFKRIRNASLAIAGACGSAAVAYSQLPAGVVDLIPAGVMKALAIGGVIAAFLAQLTKEEN
jgi:hypothetical protein